MAGRKKDERRTALKLLPDGNRFPVSSAHQLTRLSNGHVRRVVHPLTVNGMVFVWRTKAGDSRRIGFLSYGLQLLIFAFM